MRYRLRSIAVIACLSLAACGGGDVKESLGLTHRAPDEFKVYSRPPLSVPPEFALRPPAQGEEFSNGTPAQDQARSQILGGQASPSPFTANASPFATAGAAVTPVISGSLPTNADSEFLTRAGVATHDPNIRGELQQDSGSTIAPKNSPYLLGGATSADPLVDPAKEADRLKQDKAQNQPPTTGDTPVIVPKDKGFLSSIF